MSNTSHPNLPPIVDAATLAQLLQTRDDIAVIDVRSFDNYTAEHILEARFFDLSQINIQNPPVSGLLPNVTEFNQAMSMLGVLPDQTVVVYDTSGGPPAGRFAWTLQAFQHTAVSILDGGIQAWLQQGLPVSSSTIMIKPTDYSSAGVDKTIVVNAEEILANLDKPNRVLLDARTTEEFTGNDKRSAHGGHIPGAIHFDWQNLKDPATGLLKSKEEIIDALKALGIQQNQEVVCYCQSHQRSAILSFVLSAYGYMNVKGYPGAWSDWGNSSKMPVQ